MKRIYLIHGWGGSPEEGWRPWLKRELEKEGFSVFNLSMPNTNNPKLNEWLDLLTQKVGIPNKDTYFIGHSLGCITILRYLEALKENQKIGGAILVAGFSDININTGEIENINKIATFFKTNVNFEKIKNHCKRFIAIHSNNDPYVPLRYADIFKEKLSAEIIVEKNMKHFSGDDGIIKLPIALESIKKLTKVRCRQ